MSKTIYFFTGTGNSYAVARDIAQKIEARLVSISSLRYEAIIENTDEVVGFAFPLYDFKPPKMVEEFIGKLKNIEDAYLFAICTYGIKPSKGLKEADDALKKAGGRLSSGFAVQMPHNGLGPACESAQETAGYIAAWKERADDISWVVGNKQISELEHSPKIFDFMNKQVFKRFGVLMKFVRVLLLQGQDALAYKAGGKCIGCGTCQNVCQMNSIKLVDKRPVWGKECVNCFACVDWCPQSAISLGRYDFKTRMYHHPEVSIKDLKTEQ